MSKKSKPVIPPRWKVLQEDIQAEGNIEKDDPIFEQVTDNDFNEKIVDSITKGGSNLEVTIQKLLQLKSYLETRSEKFLKKFLYKMKNDFEKIVITLQSPFDETKWSDLETMDKEDLNATVVLFNMIPTTIKSLVANLKNFLKSMEITVEHIEVFPFERDSYGVPPINCRKIWNPLLWLRLKIEAVIKENNPNVQLEKLVTSLNHAPKSGHQEKLIITSFFLENTADKLDYSNCGNREAFMKNLQEKFGSLKVKELSLVLPDILIAYSEDLVERMMQVSYFIPFELFRMIFLCWQPEVLNLRLRSEACSSIEDASRIEWDDEEVFTSTTLFNCELFDRCDPVCLGAEKEIVDCQLIVDASGSQLFDPVHNEKNVNTAGRDFLVLFPMSTIFIKKSVILKSGASMKVQIKQQIEFIVNTFFFHADEHPNRVVNCQMTFRNSADVQMAMVKKCIPQVANKRKVGVNFSVEEETKGLFEKYGSRGSERNFYTSFFDSEHQFIFDLRVILT